MISIYSTNGSMAYQHGTRRGLVDAKGCTFFQKQINGQWVNGRHSYALDLIAKVKLENMINKAKEEAAQSWAFAQLSARPTKWATRQEAEDNNPGFSSRAFWQDCHGFWHCA